MSGRHQAGKIDFGVEANKETRGAAREVSGPTMTLIDRDKPLEIQKRMTYRDFLANTPEDLHAEWINGEVMPMAPISDEHADVGGFLHVILRFLVDHLNLGVVRQEPFQMKTGPGLPGRSPDILFVLKSNQKRLKKNYLDGPADVVIEIISPESRGRDRGDKFFEYEKGKVKEYWLIDPERSQAEFYLLGKNGIYKLVPIDETGIFSSTVVKGFWIKVDWLWKRPLPSPFFVLKEWKLL